MDSIIISGIDALRFQRAVSGASNANAGLITVELNRDWLEREARFVVSLSQTWGTNAPTSFDPKRVFSRIVLRTDKFANIIDANFDAFYIQQSLTEAPKTPTTAFGAGGGAAATAQFAFEIHFENDEAKRDIVTALKTQDLGSLFCDLYMSADTANGFVGGTGTAGVTTAAVRLEDTYMPQISGKANSDDGYGVAVHQFRKLQSYTGNASANTYEIQMLSGDKVRGHRTRFLIFTAFDTTGTIPTLANGIIDYFTLDNIPTIPGGVVFNNAQAEAIQAFNSQFRAFTMAGAYILDFGDDENGWLPLGGLTQPKVKFTSRGGAPATWRVDCHQDFTEGLEKLGIVKTHEVLELERLAAQEPGHIAKAATARMFGRG